MCTVRFIGCLHLQHASMAKKRGFDNVSAHDLHLIRHWNYTVSKQDLTYILGDITMEKSAPYALLNNLKGTKIVVLGNHDKYQHIPELLKYVKSLTGAVDYKGFMLTHVPIHPNEVHAYRGNIHAHIHDNHLQEVVTYDRYDDEGSVPKPTLHKYFNVDAHLIDYKPKTIEELLSC